MKVLILTVTTGEGHNATAHALESKLRDNGCECITLDVCYFVSKLLGFSVSQGYMLSIDTFSGGYSWLYDHLEKKDNSLGKLAPPRAAFSIIAAKLRSYLENFQPDAIVCTHVFAGVPVEFLKAKGHVHCKTFGILTDFTLHPYWDQAAHFDYLVIPSSRLAWQCRQKGLRSEQLLPFGIPIHQKFLKTVPKAQSRETLGLLPDKPVVLIMGGSMGYGGIARQTRSIDRLNKCFQLIVVCGSNTEEYEKLQGKCLRHKAVITGFTDQIPLMMDAADCIVTKPGGITTSEISMVFSV